MQRHLLAWQHPRAASSAGAALSSGAASSPSAASSPGAVVQHSLLTQHPCKVKRIWAEHEPSRPGARARARELFEMPARAWLESARLVAMSDYRKFGNASRANKNTLMRVE